MEYVSDPTNRKKMYDFLKEICPEEIKSVGEDEGKISTLLSTIFYYSVQEIGFEGNSIPKVSWNTIFKVDDIITKAREQKEKLTEEIKKDIKRLDYMKCVIVGLDKEEFVEGVFKTPTSSPLRTQSSLLASSSNSEAPSFKSPQTTETASSETPQTEKRFRLSKEHIKKVITVRKLLLGDSPAKSGRS
jgi:hypothetical protein